MRILVKIQIVILAVAVLFVPLSAQAQITPTPTWVNFYGGNSQIDGAPVPVGASVQVFDASGVLCGAFTVRSAGMYGFLACYMDDPNTPADEGARPGESVNFVVNGIPAGSVAIPGGVSNGARIQFNFSILSTVVVNQPVLSCIDGYEPDDKLDLASSLTGPAAHTFYSEDKLWDQDWATFDAKANWTYQIKARSQQPLTMVKPVLRLYDAAGTLIAENDMDKWGRGAEIWWWNDGGNRKMTLVIEEAEGRYGCLHYELSLTPFSPDEMTARFGR